MGMTITKAHTMDTAWLLAHNSTKMIKDATGVAFMALKGGIRNSCKSGIRQPKKANNPPTASAKRKADIQ